MKWMMCLVEDVVEMVVVLREVREYHHCRECIGRHERMKKRKEGKWIFGYVWICV
jgi:hypothetical protein